jgi:hypothetical protein
MNKLEQMEKDIEELKISTIRTKRIVKKYFVSLDRLAAGFEDRANAALRDIEKILEGEED